MNRVFRYLMKKVSEEQVGSNGPFSPDQGDTGEDDVAVQRRRLYRSGLVETSEEPSKETR